MAEACTSFLGNQIQIKHQWCIRIQKDTNVIKLTFQAAVTAVSSVITSGMQQYNNFVEERLKKRTKPLKKPLQTNKLHVFVQQPPPSLSKLGDTQTGKKADLLQCLEPSPLGSANADEEEVLVDETNNTDYEETVDPVTDDIAIEELSEFISGTELEPCTQEEEQLISKDAAAYIAADSSPEADVKIRDGAFAVQMLSPRTSNTFQDYSNSVLLPYIF